MRGRVAIAFILALLLEASSARAWYFPEHVVLSRDGQSVLAPEIRAVLAAAVTGARRDGLTLCERIDPSLDELLVDTPLQTPMIRTPQSVPCVPYSALSGLAADHASDVAELRTLLTSRAGITLVSAVAYEWRRFIDSARRGERSLDRMSFVHELDVALYFLDPGYVPRARATRVHFRDVGRSFETVLRELATDGRIDEVFARFTFHHLRSLILARMGRHTEALLDHAFAVHFLQDAFASGHLVMSPASWAEGRDAVRWRHDAFNADGLPVQRAMAHEPCATLESGTLELAGLTPCWTTSGDGYLSVNADATDRLHAAGALSRAEIAFALALDPERVLAYASSLGDLELVSFAAKLDPAPWWTVEPSQRRKLPAGPKHALRVVRRAAAAASRLTELALPTAAGVDTARATHAVDPAVVAGVLDSPPVFADAEEEQHEPTTGAPPEHGESAGHAAGLALLRPTLAQLPAAQADTSAMRPEGHLDHGWAIQIFAAAGAMLLVPARSPVDFVAPAVSLSGGFSYRWGTLLPGRRARHLRAEPGRIADPPRRQHRQHGGKRGAHAARSGAALARDLGGAHAVQPAAGSRVVPQRGSRAVPQRRAQPRGDPQRLGRVPGRRARGGGDRALQRPRLASPLRALPGAAVLRRPREPERHAAGLPGGDRPDVRHHPDRRLREPAVMGEADS